MNAMIEKTKQRSERPLLDREYILQRDRRYWRVRRFQDVVISIIMMVLLMPLMLLVCLAIVIDSPGASPIFCQNRVGRDGKIFCFYKFRSMRPNAENELEDLLKYNEMQGPVFKIREDPRITRVGKWIRKTSIDELPQLWNIIKGDMSLVGPRPGLEREVEQYSDYERQRLLITPGLTCYWQIQPDRNKVSFEEWVELDIQYMMERSFFVDWKILFKTVAVVLGMNGS